jgi:hypothetical protein
MYGTYIATLLGLAKLWKIISLTARDNLFEVSFSGEVDLFVKPIFNETLLST